MHPRLLVDGHWSGLVEEKYEHEKELQGLIAESPEILPITAINPRFAGAFTVGTECVTDGNTIRIDVLLMNSDGYVTLVETKLAANPEQSRTVVAQCLHYLAGLPTTFAELEGYYRKFVKDPSASLFARVRNDDDEIEEEDFRELVEERLRSRDVLVLIAGDRIKNAERLLAMLSRHDGDIRGLRARFGVVGVQKFQANGVRVVVPVTYGRIVTSHRTEVSVNVTFDGARLVQRVVSSRDVMADDLKADGIPSTTPVKDHMTPEAFRDALVAKGLGDVFDQLLSPAPPHAHVEYGASTAMVRARGADWEIPVFYVDANSMTARVSTNTTKAYRKYDPPDMSAVERLHAAFQKAFPQAKLITGQKANAVTTPLSAGDGAKLNSLLGGFVADVRRALEGEE